MRVSCDEGVASHIGPESCVGVCKGVIEALTGERAGWVLSPESFIVRSADGLRPSEGNTGRIASARFGRAPRGLRPQARTETPRKGGQASRSEAGRSPVRPRLGGVRAEHPKGERRR